MRRRARIGWRIGGVRDPISFALGHFVHHRDQRDVERENGPDRFRQLRTEPGCGQGNRPMNISRTGESERCFSVSMIFFLKEDL
jgi:hypothetical protein